MRGYERSVVAHIMESLQDECLDDDEQMALLLKQLVVVESKDLPIEDLMAFLLNTVEDDANNWLLANYCTETWSAGVDLVRRCPERISVVPVIEALSHAYTRSFSGLANDTDTDMYLENMIDLAGVVGVRFPIDRLLPLLADERIRVRRAVIEALWQHAAVTILASMLADSSSQIRRLAMDHLSSKKKLTVDQAQALALDPSPRVKEAALSWLKRNHADAMVASTYHS